MSWIGLEYPLPGRVIRSTWGQKVYEALDILYERSGPFYGGYVAGDLIPDVDLLRSLGLDARRFRVVHAGWGYFTYDLYVQDKRVLKDGDPITIADILAEAKTDITQAIDSSQATGYLASIDSTVKSIDSGVKIYSLFDEAKTGVAEAIDSSQAYAKVTSIDDKLVEIIGLLKPAKHVRSLLGYAYTTAYPAYPTSLSIRRMIIKVDKNAPAGVWIGDPASQEFLLDPGEKQEILVDDASKVYVRSTVDGVKFYLLLEHD